MIVAGGVNEDSTADLDTTEIYVDNIWRIITTRLPEGILGLQIKTLDNRVLLFGKL